MERKYYIDNLRLLCILLLIPYHAAMAYNCWGESNYIFIEPNRVLSSFVAFTSPWYMTLMFLLAGMSARYSQRRRTGRQFLKERVEKLIVPLVSSTFLVAPILSFFADRTNCGYTGGFFEHYPVFLSRWTDLTGCDGGFTIAHLWFLLYLFVISLIGLAVDKLVTRASPRVKAPVLLTALLLVCAMLLSPLKLGGKSFLTFLLLYLTGFYFLSDEGNIEKLAGYKYVWLLSWLGLGFVNVYMFLWSDWGLDAVNTVISCLSGLFGILTLLCFGRELISKSRKTAKRLTENSFQMYIFHFVWVVVFEYLFSGVTENNAVIFLSTVICSYIATFLTAEAVNRLPVVSRLFGKKRKTNKIN